MIFVSPALRYIAKSLQRLMLICNLAFQYAFLLYICSILGSGFIKAVEMCLNIGWL